MTHEPFTEHWFRLLAEGRLEPSPTEAVFDPRSGKTWGRSDWELNPEMIADFAVMKPPRPAAVLVPVIARRELTVLFTQRPQTMPTHAGQISFPGGKVERHDPDHAAAALREAEEEIGLKQQHIEVMGSLPEYVTGTGFRVTPVVALVHPPFELTADEFEVAEIFEVPMSFLMDGANHQRRSAVLPSRPGRRSFYAMPYGDYFIWGATAAMLRNLYHFLRA